ncbi:hypothetical protein J2S62_000268 [Enteractinococcus fodinae]|uniref:Uncharacterized protein n=1 Tax=Enteractinococcus fodinae TaxID=684663 RepID=A0ABU2AXC9_9MICC|nr:hypothetical protein [Enteractinococcus fodinae]
MRLVTCIVHPFDWSRVQHAIRRRCELVNRVHGAEIRGNCHMHASATMCTICGQVTPEKYWNISSIMLDVTLSVERVGSHGKEFFIVRVFDRSARLVVGRGSL